MIVAAAGKLVAYDAATGAPRWVGPDGGPGYSSPHLLTIHGVPQILLLDAKGATSVSPANGTRLWNVTVTSSGMAAPIVQPAHDRRRRRADQRRRHQRVAPLRGDERRRRMDGDERWSTNGLKPYFNDFVVHKGHAFGFDGSILACIDLADGKRKWKGGRYGNGQLMLLPDQDLLLVVTEEGELALVAGHRRTSSPSSAASRRSTARPGTIPCWPAMSCWFATARRWPRSGWPRIAARRRLLPDVLPGRSRQRQHQAGGKQRDERELRQHQRVRSGRIVRAAISSGPMANAVPIAIQLKP